MSDVTWDVKCHVCGFKLGTNKEYCGQGGAGGRKTRNPPCVWAHTDEKIVRRAFAFAKAAADEEEEKQRELQETMAKYAQGFINFDEPEDHQHEGSVNNADSHQYEEEERTYAPPPAASSPSRHPAPSLQEPEAKKAKSGHTKWTSTTRTMLFKCIQQKDPFHASDKGATWQIIADHMQQSTASLDDTADGDLRVVSNGKTLSVFFKRMRDAYKERDGDDKHSGGTGDKQAETVDDKQKKDERVQLAACIELERAADVAVEDRRASIKTHDNLKNGIVNEVVINCALKDEKVRIKVVKELASRLRQAKMRKMAFESQNKDATYTYTAKDLEEFGHWEKLKKEVHDMPDLDDLDDTAPAQKAGTALAKALHDVSAQCASARATFTPISPSAFAQAFFEAKKAHTQVLTLKQKLQVVDTDMDEGTITAEEASIYKKRIKELHYSFGSP
jgi:hypothetical protein